MERLGYTRYVAQGGDWGNAVTEQLALLKPEGLLGIHTNMPATVPPEVSKALATGGPKPDGLSGDEEKAYEILKHFFATGVGYANEMANRPQTLYAIADSPVGLAAWMLDHDERSYQLIARAFAGDPGGLSRDDVLDNVTHYWLTNTASPRPASTGRAIWPSSTSRASRSRSASPSSRTSSTRLRRAGRRRRIRSSSTTTGLRRAATSPPGSSRRSSRRSCATPSGHCVDLRALAVGTERLRTQMSVEASQDSAAAEQLFGPLRQIDAGLLNVGYVDIGPAEGPVVVLLHGWPYDIHSYVDVCPGLAEAGYRVIVPYLRGFGTTRFLSDETVRNGEQAALALDVIALMDALEIERAILAGFDWGARTADVVAALWPERCRGLVSVSGYLIGSQEAGKLPLPPRLSSSGGISTTSPPTAVGPVTTSTGVTLPS